LGTWIIYSTPTFLLEPHIDSKTGPGKGVGMLRIIDENWLTISILLILLSNQTVPVYAEYQLSATHSVSYANEFITVNNTIKYTGPIYAFAMSIRLPDNVIFISSNTNSQPAIQPQKGDMGKLEFIWIKPPESPCKLIYSVKSETRSGVIQSRVTYRRRNGALYYDLPNVHLMP